MSHDVLPFNTAPAYNMHIDINSCFATIEQQANPLLRGKPIVVAAYATGNGCILAASVEAKQKYRIKTGMRVKEAKLRAPDLLVFPPDPEKYRFVHKEFKKLFSRYVPEPVPKSIDEFVLDFSKSEIKNQHNMISIAKEIQQNIRKEVGEWMMVSIGIGPNRFLAKTGAGYKKPNGVTLIDHTNAEELYKTLKLTDLCGINVRNELRLNIRDIRSVSQMYNAPLWKLKLAFGGIVGYYWYLRLRGWEIDSASFDRKSYGHSYSLPKPLKTKQEVSPILTKLVQKTGTRLRRSGYKTQGVSLLLTFQDKTYFHRGCKLSQPVFDSGDIYAIAERLLAEGTEKEKTIRLIAVTCFNLQKDTPLQLNLYQNVVRKEALTKTVDTINGRFGNFTVAPARMVLEKGKVLDRIAFGAVKEL